MTEEKKPPAPRAPRTWADVTALGIAWGSILGAIALVIWAFK